MRFLEAADRKGEGPTVSELDRRYRHVPPFGPDTIRKFSSNALEQKKLAARDYANLLQCAIPVFDRLLPEPHNAIVLKLLLNLAEWHALAKLRMHTELTVKLLEEKTTELANQVQNFMNITCQAYETIETTKEYAARVKRSAKKDKQANPSNPTMPLDEQETSPSPSTAPLEGSALSQACPSQGQPPIPPLNPTPSSSTTHLGGSTLNQSPVQLNTSLPASKTSRKSRLRKTLNIQTYKYHALADYAGNIRRFGTTDSYSTERGELEHKFPKSWFPRTNKKAYRRQLARIERRRAALRKIRQNVHTGKAAAAKSRKKAIPVAGRFCAYIIAKSQSSHLPLNHFVPREVNDHDPALKGFLTDLQKHLASRLEATLRRQNPERFQDTGEPNFELDPNFISFVDGRIYTHQTLHLTYTAYDGRQGDDIIWPSGSKADIMLLNPSPSSTEDHPFIYGKVLGIYHTNVVYVKGFQGLPPERFSFLWVRWYRRQAQSTEAPGLEIVQFPPVTETGAFGFVDPGNILRACHIVPRLSIPSKKSHESMSENAQDANDHPAYLVNRFADRDIFMRYMWGYAVGHCYTHNSTPPSGERWSVPALTASSKPGTILDITTTSTQPAATVLPPQVNPTSSVHFNMAKTRDVLHGMNEGAPATILPLDAEDEMIYERSDIESGSSDEGGMSDGSEDSGEE